MEQYLQALPPERRGALERLRAVINRHIDPGFREQISYNMIGWVVPHETYPAGYHCDPSLPVPFAALASQKNAISLYFTHLYGSEEEMAWFQAEWAKTGKRLDMGKSCVRLKSIEEAPLDLIGRAMKRVTVKKYLAQYEKMLSSR